MGNNPTPPPPGKGRPKGTPNRATVEAREAIAKFVDGNVERLNGWLEAIADGEKDKDGKDYIRRPDPHGAFSALMSVVEYHVPKLARSEHTGADGKDLPPAQFIINVNGVSVKDNQ